MYAADIFLPNFFPVIIGLTVVRWSDICSGRMMFFPPFAGYAIAKLSSLTPRQIWQLGHWP